MSALGGIHDENYETNHCHLAAKKGGTHSKAPRGALFRAALLISLVSNETNSDAMGNV